MNDEEVFEYLFSITDEQAENSEIDGDSDYEDDLPSTFSNDTESSVLRSSNVSQISSNLSSNSVDLDIMNMSVEILDNVPSTSAVVQMSTPSTPHIDFSEISSVDTSDFFSNSPGIAVPQKNKKVVSKQPLIFKWQKKCTKPVTFKKFKFIQPFGPNVQVDLDSPLAIFETFFDDELFNIIITQTQLYATQKNKNFSISIEEIKAFFGILIIMGFHKLPTLRSYWSTDFNFSVSRISNIMSLKRFLQILRFLHINDNTKMPKRGEPNHHKLYKVLPLIENLKKKFILNFNPSRNIAIDESMIACKGRTTLKQYMPLKPIKRGIKVWAAACSKTGYLLNFDIYQGKQGDPEVGLGERVVTSLSSPFDNKGFCFYFDGFFSNVPMMEKMLKKKNFGCGTIKSNRKYFPSAVLKNDKSFITGEFDIATSKKELSVSKWKDRGTKCVNVISNLHDTSVIGVVHRKDHFGNKHLIKCPNSIVDYNKYMGGVDHFDQFHSFYNISWKSRRWWMKIFYYLLDASIVNSYILYKVTSDLHDPKSSKLTHLQFRSALANQLIADYTSRKQPGVRPNIRKKLCKDSGKTVVNDFYKLQNIGDHQPTKGTYRRCGYCSTKNKPKRSNIICKKCDIALCLVCFYPFHNA